MFILYIVSSNLVQSRDHPIVRLRRRLEWNSIYLNANKRDEIVRFGSNWYFSVNIKNAIESKSSSPRRRKSTSEERSIVSLTRSLTKRPWLTSRAARKWLWNWNMKFMCQLTPPLTIRTSWAHVSFPIDETQLIKGWLTAQCRAIVWVTFFSCDFNIFSHRQRERLMLLQRDRACSH